MADIRIKDLATTAASTASDDFVAVDGSANGTRKLNAYSPTFGGNLTVSGTGNSSVAGNLGIGETSPVVPLHVKTTGTGTGDFDNAIATFRSTAAGRTITLQFSDTTNQSYISSKSGALNFGVGGATLGMSLSSAGNLTVSGTGTSSVAGNFGIGTTSPGGKLDVQSASAAGNTVLFRGGSYTNIAFATGVRFVAPASTLNSNRQFRFTSGDSSLTIQGIDGSGGDAGDTTLLLQPSGGNLLIGTTTDSANGKLQLATHTTSAGGIGFGTDTSLYRSQTGMLALDGLTGSLSQLDLRVGGVQKAFVAWNGGDFYLGAVVGTTVIKSSNTTALTLDSSQVAKFASSVAVNGTTTSQALHVNVDVYGNSKSGGMRIGNSGNNYYSDLLITTDGSANPTLKQSFATHTLSEYGYAGAGNSWKWYTNNTLALTLDSSQRCILAGALRLNNAYVSGAPTATGYVTLQDSAGNTYKVLVGT